MSTNPHEPDGFSERLQNAMRIALTLAAQLGERLARERQARMRDAEARSAEEARGLRAELDAGRAAARGVLSGVSRPEWWQTAEAEDIAEAWGAASEWRGEDPAIDAARDRILSEVRDRYGLDLGGPGGADVVGALSEAGRARADGEHATAEDLEERARATRDAAAAADRPAGVEEARALADDAALHRDLAEESAAEAAASSHPAERDMDPGAVKGRQVVAADSGESVGDAVAAAPARRRRGAEGGPRRPRVRERGIER